MEKVIVNDQLTKILTIKTTKKLNGIKMNPYQPPENKDRENPTWKTIALGLLIMIAMVHVVLIYLFVVGSVVRWLS